MNDEFLKQLAPPHAPPPPGWWPLAPGWWALAALVLMIAAAAIYWYRRKPNRLRRAALRELRQLQMHAHDDAHLASALQDLLRRYAIAAYGREQVAHLSGNDWLDFLIAHGGNTLAGEAGESLLRAAYGSRMLNDRAPWLQGARDFLRGRR
ncbi:DUF4381 domain-containing protein [Sideroxydans lithotrophicus]|uniref:DUF4381 domain-containing protein n=1 Tax=Sideroxydans lithotrophicus (strain ES-1) TaxID=580332 RepID=D5CPE2_SIDLE|nr:DUF4381 domain-containing protein [Sideroxydans lithotrophicus]ADE11083.1 hypothetical protein Slit_0845 [Sideroxydans lithotrophicus ES-1]